MKSSCKGCSSQLYFSAVSYIPQFGDAASPAGDFLASPHFGVCDTNLASKQLTIALRVFYQTCGRSWLEHLRLFPHKVEDNLTWQLTVTNNSYKNHRFAHPSYPALVDWSFSGCPVVKMFWQRAYERTTPTVSELSSSSFSYR
jgi:hypothetical protein